MKTDAEKFAALLEEGPEVLAARVMKLERQLEEAFDERDRTLARVVDDRNRLHDALMAERKKTAALAGAVVEATAPSEAEVLGYVEPMPHAPGCLGDCCVTLENMDAKVEASAAEARAARRAKLLG